MDELITHVSEKTYAYGAIRAENQNLLVTISEFEARMKNGENGSIVKRPKSRDSHVKTSVLDVSKNEAKKEAVYVRKNKQTDNTFANVVFKTRIPKSSETTFVAPKTRFSEKATQSKTLDTTYVASKSKIDEASASKARDKVSSEFKKKKRLAWPVINLKPPSCLKQDSDSSLWQKVVQIVLWIVDSGCSKHMTGDHSLLRNFVEKFMGTVRFGNDNFAAITGYGDYIHGNITICHVYYVEGLGHNLFSVGQFCDGDLEVAFRSKTCYVRNLEGDDLIIGGRDWNLYTISISDMSASSPICLMSKATLTKSWLWHRRLSHLNFGTINDLTKLDLVDGFAFHLQPTHDQEDSPSTSSIIVDTHEAPPVVTTSDEQTSPISLQESDEFNQEDSADFDGNTQFVPYDSLNRVEIESSTTNLEPSNV
ncbi:integrase, catalytic region, zinc finger, CCHC-type containing protein [Tanacetum coccineum]